MAIGEANIELHVHNASVSKLLNTQHVRLPLSQDFLLRALFDTVNSESRHAYEDISSVRSTRTSHQCHPPPIQTGKNEIQSAGKQIHEFLNLVGVKQGDNLARVLFLFVIQAALESLERVWAKHNIVSPSFNEDGTSM